MRAAGANRPTLGSLMFGMILLTQGSLAACSGASPGLLAAHGFDEVSGDTVEEVSGRGAGRGRFQSGVQRVQGKFGGALLFDGVSGRLDLVDSLPMSAPTGFTLSAWVYPQRRGAFQRIVEHGGILRGPFYEYSLLVNPRGQVQAGVGLDRGSVEVPGAAVLPLEQWSHVAATWDGASLRLYVNGRLDRTGAASGSVTDRSNATTVGYRRGGNVSTQHLQGAVDDLRIYDHARSATQIEVDMYTPLASADEGRPRPPIAPGGRATEPGDPGIAVGQEEIVVPHSRKPYAWPDGPMGVIKSRDGYVFIAAANRHPIRCVGSLDNPVSGGCVKLAIQGAKDRYDYIAGGPIYYHDPRTGVLLLSYHAEIWARGDWRLFYSLQGLAKSTDGGYTWRDLGLILTPNVDFDRNAQDWVQLTGGAVARVGEYLHLYFKDTLTDGTSAEIAVARAKYADVVDAAVNRNTVVAWHKYHDGAWMERGIGGRASPMERPNTATVLFDVSYNQHLGRYIMVAAGEPWPATNLYWLESDDGVTWRRRRVLVEDQAHKVYATIVGLGEDPRVTDRTFYIYYISSRGFALGAPSRNTDAVLARRRITLSDSLKAGTTPPLARPEPGVRE